MSYLTVSFCLLCVMPDKPGSHQATEFYDVVAIFLSALHSSEVIHSHTRFFAVLIPESGALFLTPTHVTCELS